MLWSRGESKRGLCLFEMSLESPLPSSTVFLQSCVEPKLIGLFILTLSAKS